LKTTRITCDDLNHGYSSNSCDYYHGYPATRIRNHLTMMCVVRGRERGLRGGVLTPAIIDSIMTCKRDESRRSSAIISLVALKAGLSRESKASFKIRATRPFDFANQLLLEQVCVWFNGSCMGTSTACSASTTTTRWRWYILTTCGSTGYPSSRTRQGFGHLKKGGTWVSCVSKHHSHWPLVLLIVPCCFSPPRASLLYSSSQDRLRSRCPLASPLGHRPTYIHTALPDLSDHAHRIIQLQYHRRPRSRTLSRERAHLVGPRSRSYLRAR
jgi:hypothetical protein